MSTMSDANGKTPDQPKHPSSLIKVFAGRRSILQQPICVQTENDCFFMEKLN